MEYIQFFWVEWLLMAGVFALLLFILRARMKKRAQIDNKVKKVSLGLGGRILYQGVEKAWFVRG